MRNVDVTVLPSGVYNAAQDIPLVNEGGSGIVVFINVTNANGGTLVVTIQGVDPVSKVKSGLLASAAIVANSMTVLRVAPGIPVAANIAANDLLPRSLNININPTVAAMTFSVGASLVSQ